MTAVRTGLLSVAIAVLLIGASGATAWAAMPTDETTTANPDDAEFVTDDLVFEQERNQTIRGETTLEPGTNLSLSVEGENFYMSQVVTVTDRGTFEGTFDFSTKAPGEELEITLRHGRTTLAETTGEIEPCPDGCETTETVETVRTVDPAATTASDDDGLGRLVGGVGTIALGGVLAVVGIGVLLGLFRN